jgi:hypothetical protein
MQVKQITAGILWNDFAITIVPASESANNANMIEIIIMKARFFKLKRNYLLMFDEGERLG